MTALSSRDIILPQLFFIEHFVEHLHRLFVIMTFRCHLLLQYGLWYSRPYLKLPLPESYKCFPFIFFTAYKIQDYLSIREAIESFCIFGKTSVDLPRLRLQLFKSVKTTIVDLGPACFSGVSHSRHYSIGACS
jgi:hypothetical protein